MEKKKFIILVMSVLGCLLFGIGMSMALLPEMEMFQLGINVGVIGISVLIATIITKRKFDGKPAIVLNKKTMGIAFYGTFSALFLGVGMCMTMVWEGLMLQGIIVGIIGIVLLLGLIPMAKGIK